MKRLLIPAVAAAILTGCAVPGPYYAAQPVDPYQWRTVSVTPVAPGTAARAGSTVTYTTEPLPAAPSVTYVQQPVYVPQTVYAPAPVYGAPAYWFPPISIGLDFVWSRHSGGWGRGYHGGWRGRR
jgi:Prokaryotic membrane lipoprotein lipid attachment site